MTVDGDVLAVRQIAENAILRLSRQSRTISACSAEVKPSLILSSTSADDSRG
jgi:hypothetical protein